MYSSLAIAHRWSDHTFRPWCTHHTLPHISVRITPYCTQVIFLQHGENITLEYKVEKLNEKLRSKDVQIDAIYYWYLFASRDMQTEVRKQVIRPNTRRRSSILFLSSSYSPGRRARWCRIPSFTTILPKNEPKLLPRLRIPQISKRLYKKLDDTVSLITNRLMSN